MMTENEKKKLTNYIYNFIKENYEFGNTQFQEDSSEKAKEDVHKSNDNESAKKRSNVLHVLNAKLNGATEDCYAINHAALMRILWSPKDKNEEDTYRSEFSKCFKPDGDLEFTDAEITRLYDALNELIQ